MQGEQRVQQEMQRFRADAAYFDAHRGEFLQRYPDQWVAVYAQEVVGAAKDIKRLVKQLERKGIRPGRTYRQYVTDKEELLILFAAR